MGIVSCGRAFKEFYRRKYMKKFYITSTINIEAESRSKLVEELEHCKENLKDDTEIAWNLVDMAEIDENNE